MSIKCWRLRGCDAIMARTCPHATASTDGRCVIGCYYTNCPNPQYKVATSLDLLLDPNVDRSAAIKESCTYCEHFLLHGPRLPNSAKVPGCPSVGLTKPQRLKGQDA